MITCENGHEYDETTNSECPVCKQEQQPEVVEEKTAEEPVVEQSSAVEAKVVTEKKTKEKKIKEKKVKVKKVKEKKISEGKKVALFAPENRKKLIVIITCCILGVLIVVAGVFVALKLTKQEYVINEEVTKFRNIELTSGYLPYSSNKLGISFMIPYDAEVDYSKKTGCTISFGEEQEYEIAVNYFDDETTTPDKFFKSVKARLEDDYDDVEAGRICEVKIEDKTLYMVRYQVKDGKDTLYVDVYLEIYEDSYVTYELSTKKKGTLDEILAEIIVGLYLSDEAYDDVELPTSEETDVTTVISEDEDEAV